MNIPFRKRLFELILLTVMGVVMYVSQVIMASLPNIELVSLLIILIARKFNYKSLISVYIFVFCEIATYGFSVWVVNYLYVWAVLAVVVCLVRKIDNTFFYAFLSALYGIAFGTLCAIPYFFYGGFTFGITYIANGLWFDLLHSSGNFIIALVLYKPLTIAFNKAIKD